MPRMTTTNSRPSNVGISKDQLAEAIRKKAYELYEKRGRKAGHSLNDWLEAERIVKGKFCDK